MRDVLSLVPQTTQESVTPAETSGGVDPAFSGRYADTQALNHLLGKLQPLLLFPQASQGCSSGCVENLLAAITTVALHSL